MSKRKASECPLENISEDGILHSIISLLTMREAARTCILSRRWRYIWRYMPMPNLIFDAPNMLVSNNLKPFNKKLKISSGEYNALFRERTEKFIKSVDGVLQHHRGKGLETFKVHFSFDQTYATHIDRWVRFAIKENPKEIVLKLEEREIECLPGSGLYEFPCHLFVGQVGSSLASLCLAVCSLRVPPRVDGFKSLKAVDLNEIFVSDRDIPNLLSNCFLIELLSLRCCFGLVNLEIAQPLCRLKYLNVDGCCHLKNIELSATNLTTFEYRGNWIRFVFGEASSLTKAYICINSYCQSPNVMDYCLSRLSRDLPHLQALFLDFTALQPADNKLCVTKFDHLKHLVTNVYRASIYIDLLDLVTLLSAAPYVEKFEVHLQGFVVLPDKSRKIRRPRNCPHYHLKEVEITGFTGRVCQIELARYLLHNATALESMTIIQKQRKYEERRHDRWKLTKTGEPDVSHKTYAYLRTKASSNAKLEIL